MLNKEKEIFFKKILVLLNAQFTIKKIGILLIDQKENLTMKEKAVAEALYKGDPFYLAVKKGFLLSDMEYALFSTNNTEESLKNILSALRDFKKETAIFSVQIIITFFFFSAFLAVAYFGFIIALNYLIPNISAIMPDFMQENIKIIILQIEKALPIFYTFGSLILVVFLLIAIINPLLCETFFISRPLLGKLRKYAVLNRFFTLLSMLSSYGVELKKAFEIAIKPEKNYIGAMIKNISIRINKGDSLGEAFLSIKKGFFPPYVVKMAEVAATETEYGKAFKYTAKLLELDFYAIRNKIAYYSAILIFTCILFFIIAIFFSAFFLFLINL